MAIPQRALPPGKASATPAPAAPSAAIRPGSGAWLRHPLAESLLRFDLLPSLLLHPARAVQVMPPSARALLAGVPEGTPAWSRLHRHWSQALRQSLGLPALQDANDPALCLAMLPQPAWDRLVRQGGTLLAAPRLRQVVARGTLSQLHTELGSEAMTGVFDPAIPTHPELPEALALPLPSLGATCLAWGEAWLARALGAATPAVAQRGLLRLPDAAEAALPSTGAAPSAAQALALALSLIQRIDPQWHSSFPAAR